MVLIFYYAWDSPRVLSTCRSESGVRSGPEVLHQEYDALRSKGLLFRSSFILVPLRQCYHILSWLKLAVAPQRASGHCGPVAS